MTPSPSPSHVSNVVAPPSQSETCVQSPKGRAPTHTRVLTDVQTCPSSYLLALLSYMSFNLSRSCLHITRRRFTFSAPLCTSPSLCSLCVRSRGSGRPPYLRLRSQVSGHRRYVCTFRGRVCRTGQGGRDSHGVSFSRTEISGGRTSVSNRSSSSFVNIT